MTPNEQPAILVYQISAMLTWSTFVEGRGRSLESARHELMGNALSTLSDKHLARLQRTLASEATE